VKKTAKRIRRFVEDELLDPRDAGGGDPLGDGRLDSLAIEQLAFFLEDEFGIEITAETVEPEMFTSIDALAAYVDAHRKAPSR
jgi:acyl carrier protein